MNLYELLLYNPQNKKELIKFIKSKGLSYKVKSYRIEVSGLKLDDFGTVDITYSRNGNIITYINVSIKKSSADFAELKELCYDLFGKPYSDSTNHYTDNPEIVWKKGHLYAPHYDDTVYVVGAPFKISHLNSARLYKCDGSWFVFGISMLGGLVWGILFYFFFGLGYGHTSLLFTLSMIGGVVMGLVMSLIFVIIPRFEIDLDDREAKFKFKKREAEMLNEYGRKSFQNSLSSLVRVNFYIKNRTRGHMAKMFVNDSGVHMAYARGKRIDKKSIPYSDILEVWGSNNLSIITLPCRGDLVISISHVDENYDKIFRYIEDRLGYNSERALSIEEIIYNCIIEYDPASVIALGSDPSQFRDNAKYMARKIIKMDNPTSEEVIDAVNQSLCDDDYLCRFDELGCKIFKSLAERGLVK